MEVSHWLRSAQILYFQSMSCCRPGRFCLVVEYMHNNFIKSQEYYFDHVTTNALEAGETMLATDSKIIPTLVGVLSSD